MVGIDPAALCRAPFSPALEFLLYLYGLRCDGRTIPPREAPPLKLRPLVCLALMHMLVDGYAQVLAPLWPRLQADLGLGAWGLTLLVSAWQLAASLSQPLFGCWGDRCNGRWMVGAGPALVVVCVSLLGLAHGPVALTGLLVLGGLGVGAFHPEAAVGVVEASGSRAARGLSLFTFGGMLGLGLGPVLSGTLADTYGLHGLAWTAPPALLFLAVLILARRPVPPPLVAAAVAPVRRTASAGGDWRPAVLLLGVATLRAIPALGVPLGMAFLLEQRGESEAAVGWSQSVFLLSGGLGTLACPLLVRPGRELVVLFGLSVPAAGCLMLLAWDQPATYYVGLVGSGLLLQGAIPILIAYSQRILPHGQRLAASLTLGASWGLAGMAVAVMQAAFEKTGHLEGMLWAMVPFAAAAALAVCFLPRVPSTTHRIAQRQELAPVADLRV
jgi:FSR family fosmidomycin resistance protein-like MFS transporter